MNILDFGKDDEVVTYFDVQNLSINHPLNSSDLEEYKDLIFSPNSLRQIYFKDDCDLKSIFIIKNLLTISDYVDDSEIDKVVLLKLSKKDFQVLLTEKYENPETWSIPYEEENDKFYLADLPSMRRFKSFIKKLNIDLLSPFEKVMRVYDVVKLMNFDNKAVDESLPMIIETRKTDSYGFNKLFSYILDSYGFKTYVGSIKSSDGSESSITIVEIVDKDYGIDGIYVFDPSMDNLSKDKYEKDDVRRVNYNFFGIPLNYMNRLSYNDRLDGILSILSIDDLDYSKEKMEVCKSTKIIKQKESLLDRFNLSFDQLHQRLRKSKIIDIDNIVKANNKIYQNNGEEYSNFLKENYETRRDELFDKDSQEELEEMIEKEKHFKK